MHVWKSKCMFITLIFLLVHATAKLNSYMMTVALTGILSAPVISVVTKVATCTKNV